MQYMRDPIVVAHALLLASFATAQPKSEDSSNQLAAMANGYRANLESFPFVSCKYNITFSFAKTLEDAQARRYQGKEWKPSAAYYKDGPVVRFRIEEDPLSKALREKPRKERKLTKLDGLQTGPLIPFYTMDSLFGKSHGVGYTPSNHNANIFSSSTQRAKEIDGDFLFTWIGVNTKWDFGLLADRAVAGEIPYAITKGNMGGIFHVRFDLEPKQNITFSIDTIRGCMPTRIVEVDRSGELDVMTKIIQYRSCSKDRWFPEQLVCFQKQLPTQSPSPTKFFQVTELDVDKKPPEEVFALDLPAGTNINQFADSRKHFKVRKNERITVEDFDRIHQLTEEVPKKPQTDTAIVPPKRTHWAWYAVGGGLAAVLLALLARRFLRKRGQTHNAA